MVRARVSQTVHVLISLRRLVIWRHAVGDFQLREKARVQTKWPQFEHYRDLRGASIGKGMLFSIYDVIVGFFSSLTDHGPNL